MIRAGFSRKLAYMRRTQKLSLGLVADYCASDDVEIEPEASKENLADIFTKPLDVGAHEEMTEQLGMGEQGI